MISAAAVAVFALLLAAELAWIMRLSRRKSNPPRYRYNVLI
jgi:hypothetical protein